ncbi:MAG: hypothetical protein HYW02_08315 [Deltaproteobacteria bacterium]|nr:hypothetical protein [Deltaproteobacteria bacterium]
MRIPLLRLLRPLLASPESAPEVAGVVAQSASRVVDLLERGALHLLERSEIFRLNFPLPHPVQLAEGIAVRALRLNGIAMWRTAERSPEQTALLMSVLKKVLQTDHPVVVFDLDDTLFSTLFRHVAVLREYGRLHNVPLMTLIGPEHLTSWDLNKVLINNLGMEPVWVKTHMPAIRAFWNERFFSDRYLAYDVPLAGAAKYVQPLMKEGTLSALSRHHFPMPDGDEVTLVLKPQSFDYTKPGMSDVDRIEAQTRSDIDFKKWAVGLIQRLGKVVACVDNEPGNINMMRAAFFPEGGGYAIRPRTGAGKDIPLDPGVLLINGFLY